MLPENHEAVVLIHGMGRTQLSMWLLARRLTRAGYRTYHFQYVAAFNQSIMDMGASLVHYLVEKVDAPKYHLVGHSLGGVIIRAGFKKGYPEGLSKVVMLGTPNRPSLLAQQLKNRGAFKLFSGRAGQELASETFFEELPTPSVPFGVIAGNVGQRLTFDEDNDGIVKVSTTKLGGMADFTTVPRIHTFIMNGPETAEHCEHFLAFSRFKPSRYFS